MRLGTAGREVFVDTSFSFPMEVHLRYLLLIKSAVHEVTVASRIYKMVVARLMRSLTTSSFRRFFPRS